MTNEQKINPYKEIKDSLKPISTKSIKDNGKFIGYASVFGIVDNAGDVVLSGAFSNSLTRMKERGEKIKLLWQHDTSQPIGYCNVIKEDMVGLYVEAELMTDIPKVKEIHSLIKNGVIDSLSIGYQINKYSYDELTGNRILEDIDLWEVSLVTFPANRDAKVTSVKANPDLAFACIDQLQLIENSLERAKRALS